MTNVPISPKLRNFVRLPSDSKTPLTKDQLAAVFGNGDPKAWSEMIELVRKTGYRTSSAETPEDL